jgi:hypothetical protein
MFLPFTPPDYSIVVGMHGFGLSLFNGSSDRRVNVLDSLLQKNRVLEESLCFVISRVNITLTPMHRTDSTLMTLISYCISTGVLSW